jgi:hypothetical protein
MITEDIIENLKDVYTDDYIDVQYPILPHFTQEHLNLRAYLVEGAQTMRDAIIKRLEEKL